LLLNLRNVSYSYNANTAIAKMALKNISLELSEGDAVSIIGPIGSGKSTLAQVIAGLIIPSAGEAYIDGKLLGTAVVVKDIWKKIGIVFQNPENQLFEKTVYDDVAFGPTNLGMAKIEVKKRVQEALELVGLNYRKINQRSPFSLSGGEKRRVAIAGILAIKPKMLILDEPTTGLDTTTRGRLLTYLKNLQHDRRTTLVLISHDLEEVSYLSQNVIALNNGQVAFKAGVEELFRQHDLINELALKLPEEWQIKHQLGVCGYEISQNMPLSAVKNAIIRQALPASRQGKK